MLFDIEDLTAAEAALCDFYDTQLAALRRTELHSLYSIAERLHSHKVSVGSGLRQSMERCGWRVGKNRTTLLRYAFVYQRIKPDEFRQLVALSDGKGYPAAFWDLVETAELSPEHRRAVLLDRQLERTRSTRIETGRLRPIAGDEE
jgi:hypothetical protein